MEERLLHGDPAGSIVDRAQEIEDSLVVMMTHGRSGIARWILGSVTDRWSATLEAQSWSSAPQSMMRRGLNCEEAIDTAIVRRTKITEIKR